MLLYIYAEAFAVKYFIIMLCYLNLASILSISVQPSGSGQNTVGQRQDVICSVILPFDVDPNTIQLAWINEQDIVTGDGRITVSESNNNFESSATTLATTIQFDPLIESDEGEYTCYAAINGSFIFESIQLQDFRSKY